MRHKFRAWNEKHNLMVEVGLIDFLEEKIQLGSFEYSLDRFPIMQYTGLKDKNGVEIYEGDIIKVNKLTFESSSVLPENLNVKFYGGMFQLFRNDEPLMGLHLMYIDDGEVIGNIYDHKHLLNLPGEVDHDTIE